MRYLIICCFALLLSIKSSIGTSQENNLLDTYNLLSTIGGKGDIDDKGVNGWLPEYEEGAAVDAELSRPHIAIADAAGNIYIADKDAHAIRKIDTEGIISTYAGTSIAGDGDDTGLATEVALNAPNGLWVSAEGTCYILDLNNNKIRKVDTEGNITTILTDPDGIALGRGLWVKQAEDTIWYASGSSVKMWSEQSGIITYASGFSGLGNIARSPSGYIAATDRSANRVYKINPDGTKETIAGNGSTAGGGEGYSALESAFYGVRGIWFLEDGSYFLATHEGSQVWYIDTEGIVHLFLNGAEGDSNHAGDGENFQTPGFKISEARSVTVDYSGNVIVTENDEGYIRKVEKIKVSSIPTEKYIGGERIKVFPNPALNTVKVSILMEDTSSIVMSVYDCQGRRLELPITQKRSDTGMLQLSIDVSSLMSGVYYYQFNNSESIESGVFQVKK